MTVTMSLIRVFICVFFLYTIVLVVQSACYEPPMKCPNKNVTFWLYTRSLMHNPRQIFAYKPETIKSAPWIKDAPIKMLIHGYTGYKDFSPNTEIRPAYMECCDYNIISLDYNPIAKEPCYFQAARNTELVGMCTAQLIDTMVQDYKFNLSHFHIIGFSLGAHVAGYIANYLKSGRLERITALDPAMPLFVTTEKSKKIDSSDAKRVDVLHTNALVRGKLETCGHIDFFANGGMLQPGCKDTLKSSQSSCAHARAPLYYAESINTKVGFYARKCYSWITYMLGWCELLSYTGEILYGEYVPPNAFGIFFFATNDSSPFALGHSSTSLEGNEQPCSQTD